MIYKIIGYTATFSPLIAIIPIVIWRKSLPVALISLLSYLILCLVTDVASIALYMRFGTNLWFINCYILLIPLSLIFPFNQIILNKTLKKVSMAIFLLCFAILIPISFSIDFLGSLNNHGLAICSVATIFACMLYLVDLAIYSNVSDLSKESYIYVVIGFLIANASCAIFYMAYNIIGEEASIISWIMKFITYIILHALIAYTVFIKSEKLNVAK